MTRRTVAAPDKGLLTGHIGEDANRRLLEWLSDDDHRQKLFQLINQHGAGELSFPSRDHGQRDNPNLGPTEGRRPPALGHKLVKLITDRKRIIEILKDDGCHYSNRVYGELGGGNFMLALDPKGTFAADAHQAQVDAYGQCFPHDAGTVRELAHLAVQDACVTGLRAADFDLAAFAEQAGLRFCQKLMGYSMADFILLEQALRAGYLALVYQVFGRHFSTDPVAVPQAKQLAGMLVARTSALIEAYALEDEDGTRGCDDPAVPADFKPVLKQLAEPRLTDRQGQAIDINGELRAILAVGTAIGTVGNVQAAVCHIVQALFKERQAWLQARQRAMSEEPEKATSKHDEWRKQLWPFLAANPPIPFLPRVKVNKDGVAEDEFLLALGGATDTSSNATEDPLIWGLLGAHGTHGCLGKELAWPLIIETVRQVMSLPGLEQKLDGRDGKVIGLTKRWGFNSVSYPLCHQRDRRAAHSTLNVAMRLKPPVRDSADRVRAFIRAGAPRIERALIEARHVHFAWFELIESDSVLVLHTVYDGPFEAYIMHFALKLGDLFDALFQFIEDPPPLPVASFPNDFIAHLLRYNRSPAMGYLFSAYPNVEVAQIMRNEWAKP